MEKPTTKYFDAVVVKRAVQIFDTFAKKLMTAFISKLTRSIPPGTQITYKQGETFIDAEVVAILEDGRVRVKGTGPYSSGKTHSIDPNRIDRILRTK